MAKYPKYLIQQIAENIDGYNFKTYNIYRKRNLFSSYRNFKNNVRSINECHQIIIDDLSSGKITIHLAGEDSYMTNYRIKIHENM